MPQIKNSLSTLTLIFVTLMVSAQEKSIYNLAKLPAFANPAFHAFKEKTKLGVVSEFVSNNTNGDYSQQNYAYGTTFFEDYNFQLAVDLYNNQLNTAGYNYTTGYVTYGYKIRLNREWTTFPSISLGYSTYRFDFSQLVFQDQLDVLRNRIRSVTSDPIAMTDALGYFDMGASFMAHNDRNTIFGFSIKHLNRPSLQSSGGEQNLNLDILFSAQYGYELNLNTYGQNILPDYSYLFLFNTISKQGQNVRLDLYQDLSLQNVSLGVNQHLNFLDKTSFTELGISAGLTINKIEFGLNYLMPFGNEAKFYTPNTLEVFLLFDLSSLQDRRRMDFSRFY